MVAVSLLVNLFVELFLGMRMVLLLLIGRLGSCKLTGRRHGPMVHGACGMWLTVIMLFHVGSR
jgi:hypothetical protein